MKCSELIQKLEALSPAEFACDWDNVGLLLGNKDKEINKVMLAVDPSKEVVEQAVLAEVDLLLTHHPLIFSGEKRILFDDYMGNKLIALIKQDVNCFAMHTNFDVMGMADAAADLIGLKNREVLEITYEDDIAKEGCGRYGRLPKPISLEECAKEVKRIFALDSVRIFGKKDTLVGTCAIMPGSGGDYISHAIKAKADVMITGDIKHHQAMDALEQGITIIDAGHYGLEKIFVTCMEEFFTREVEGVTVLTATESSPFWVL